MSIADTGAALEAFRGALGPEAVLTDEGSLHACEQTNFETTQRVLAILRPTSTEEVAACVRIAQRHAVPVYPISRGKNWGLGSKVPVRSNSVVIDLGDMDQILEYNETYGYLVVQPGVSFHQAAAYLHERNSPHYVSVIGGSGEGSLIGNLLERGDGSGHYAERADFACALEVVLPDGRVITTGFGDFTESKVKHLCKWGVGPGLDGLFLQSSLGIVTRMTVWLSPIPEHFEMFLLATERDEDLGLVVDGLRELQLRRVLLSPFYLLNDYKHLANITQYPWKEAGDRTPLPAEVLEGYKKRLGFSRWNGMAAIYAEDPAILRGVRRQVKKHLGAADRLVFLNDRKVRWAARLAPILRLVGQDPTPILELWKRNPLLGRPYDRTVRSVYWRKRTPPPDHPDPDRDGCGIYWNCVVVPLAGHECLRACNLICDTILEHGFEPNLAAMLSSGYGRSIRVFVMMTYDRSIEGADAAARRCHEELFDRLEEQGYSHNRLDISTMGRMPHRPETRALYRRLKDSLDPAGVMSPGRYEESDLSFTAAEVPRRERSAIR